MTNTDFTIDDISAHAFTDEADAVSKLLAYLETRALAEDAVMAKAEGWTRKIRKDGIGHGAEAFLHAYGLNTSEGVALMCLAEALLRIPDASTADALIDSSLEGLHWERYTNNDSWLVNLSSWGLLLTGKVIDFGHDTQTGILHTFKGLVARLGEPVIREALRRSMRLIGGQFVLGETMEKALHHAEIYSEKGYRFSFDILGEGARSDAQAQIYMEAYRQGIALIGKKVQQATSLFEAPGISIKLSALHARYQLTQSARVMQELLPRLKEILLCAKQAGITVTIDAEECSRLDIEMLVFQELLNDLAFTGWNGIGFVVQAYQKRAFTLIDWLTQMAHEQKRIIPVRLVKGAYWDSEIKWAQLQGLPAYPVFTRKENTDVSYLACADKLLARHDCFYPQFATHNARTVASIMLMAEREGLKKGAYEFQRLHGMGEALHEQILKDVPSRIYAPVGAHKDLLAYLIRRLLENGANSSFVHLLTDKSKTPQEILADPVEATKAHKELYNPAIRLAPHLYDDRKNSSGIDFGNRVQLSTLQKDMAIFAVNPLLSVPPITHDDLSNAISKAHSTFPSWSITDTDARAAMLEHAADLIESHRTELMALCSREAGKTLADGVAEVREAADYCRYYAAQARKLFTPQSLTGPAGENNRLALHPRGVFACISPWNFPLAIFTGQIAAALASGNCVVAKPAEQTPCIARRALELLYKAGIPRGALQLAIGTGETIGSALVADERIDGVVFTGGTGTARRIHQTLAAREGPIIPLIAETGGQNCMVVDSSALLEQAVDDIILSAFGSAGQRCSSLRVLFVQEDIADALLYLLGGAIQELKLGDPLDLATDIGPIIDKKAQMDLLNHIATMKASARFIANAPPADCDGTFVAPHAFEIKHIGELTCEHFGPILHIIRFKAGDLLKVASDINSTGYGLTFGIHSRIEEHIRLMTSAVRAGNIYVNRSMIGATVGVQPFGGEGFSGTGPKAGGPHYLMRFTTERTLTVNTTAIGGNMTLLAGDLRR